MRGAAAADKIITNGDPALNDAASHTSFDIYFQGDNGTDVADNDILLSVNEAGKQGAVGGGGNDSFEFVNTSGVVGQVVASGGAGNDIFEFTSDFANITVARLTDSDIAGGAGEDTFDLQGGTQSTTVRGGAGVDTFTLRGDYNNSILKGGADGDVFNSTAAISLTDSKIRGQGGNDGGMLFDQTVASDSSTINGNAGNDEIRFSVAFGTISGLTVGGGTGDDLILLTGTALTDGDADGIQFNGGLGIDSITSGAGDDLINGGADADTMIAGPGTDSILGGTGDDFADGEDGDDTINGEAGDDTLEGGAGADSVLGGDGTDSILGEAGTDFLSGEAGDDTIVGAADDDTLDGGAGDDSLDGGVGNDSLIGGEGADIIITGDVGTTNTGDDTIMGGEGGDFIFLGSSTTVEGETDENKSMITAISDSEAASGEFDVIAGFDGDAIVAGADLNNTNRTANFILDIEAVKDVLAGSNATTVNFTDLTPGGAVIATTGTTAAEEFASLVTAFNAPGAPLMTASDATTIQAYTFNASVRGDTVGTEAYLVLNDPNAALTSGDLMFEFTGENSTTLAAELVAHIDLG